MNKYIGFDADSKKELAYKGSGELWLVRKRFKVKVGYRVQGLGFRVKSKTIKCTDIDLH